MKTYNKKILRISRIKIPNLSNEIIENNSHSHQERLTFFQKIKNSFSFLEEPFSLHQININENENKTILLYEHHHHNSINHKKVSQRICNLAKPRERKCKSVSINLLNLTSRNMPISKEISSSKNPNKMSLTNYSLFRSSLRNKSSDKKIVVEKENQTISGTKLGALSTLNILDQIEKKAEEIMRESAKKPFFKVQHRNEEEDEDIGDFHIELAQVQKTRERNQNSRLNTQRSTKEEKHVGRKKKNVEESLLKKIIGHKKYEQKYGEFHQALMEKNPQYKSKKFSLDYKNQWKA